MITAVSTDWSPLLGCLRELQLCVTHEQCYDCVTIGMFASLSQLSTLRLVETNAGQYDPENEMTIGITRLHLHHHRDSDTISVVSSSSSFASYGLPHLHEIELGLLQSYGEEHDMDPLPDDAAPDTNSMVQTPTLMWQPFIQSFASGRAHSASSSNHNSTASTSTEPLSSSSISSVTAAAAVHMTLHTNDFE